MDERDIKRGQHSTSRMKAACIGAKLIVFAVTPDFLRSCSCLDELRWALAEREQRGGRLPEILTVLYPAEAGTIDIDDLDPLSRELAALLPSAKGAQPIWSQFQTFHRDGSKRCCLDAAALTAGAGTPIAGGLPAPVAGAAWQQSTHQSTNLPQPVEIGRVQQFEQDLKYLAGHCVLRGNAFGR